MANKTQIILNPLTLNKVKDGVRLPTYDRSEIKTGIFHFGVGGFHRAHQALIMDNLFTMGLAKDWGICGVGIMPVDQKMRDVMRDQNCLYTLVEKESSGQLNYRVIGSIIEYIYAPDDVNALIERLTKPEARIVSLTITEGGYNTNPVTGEFDLSLVQDDLKNPKNPKTVFGIVVEALKRRKERGVSGFTIMSCDNLQENGKIAKKSFLSFAEAIDKDLSTWIEKNVTFPCSMVDRITPVTTEVDRLKISEKLGVVDQWPVVCEPFIQWVLEDDFAAGRPTYEKNIVQLVKNVAPYELMKLRLINAGHQAIAYFGLLLDHFYVHEATQNDQIVKYLQSYMDFEATSTLDPVDGIDLNQYKSTIIKRFQNPNVLDTLARLAVDGSDRIPKFVIPVIEDRLTKCESVWLSTSVVVSFTRYLNGVDDKGKKIQIVDRMNEKLSVLDKKLRKDPTAISDAQEIFGDVVKNKIFISTFKEIYEKLQNEGAKKTLDWLLSKY
ncbi:CLUMA_CG015245, isoform A [Clunio marinus]|uniref:mannitol 2-dehydrogenase n=1 Tax=Clunio marinus TaxID=568069 RepID=A0A1J1IQ31_9DIPT|nr:CLUMA_CG015245, isoform A [Clunio marinus]